MCPNPPISMHLCLPFLNLACHSPHLIPDPLYLLALYSLRFLPSYPLLLPRLSIALMPSKCITRLPPHFSLNSATGDIVATDMAGWFVRFLQEQVRLILTLNDTLCQCPFDPTTNAVPAGYKTFWLLWSNDEAKQYGLVLSECEYSSGNGQVV